MIIEAVKCDICSKLFTKDEKYVEINGRIRVGDKEINSTYTMNHTNIKHMKHYCVPCFIKGLELVPSGIR